MSEQEILRLIAQAILDGECKIRNYNPVAESDAFDFWIVRVPRKVQFSSGFQVLEADFKKILIRRDMIFWIMIGLFLFVALWILLGMV